MTPADIRARLAAAGLRVKPLEWIERLGVTGVWDAKTPWRAYIAVEEDGADDGVPKFFLTGITRMLTGGSSARAAAQADHEARILSSLEATDEP